ncbi:MAG: response regulator [Deltaproteobacteria bacterium]|nr:response regulator [Deltaproteobacteria bacterium]
MEIHAYPIFDRFGEVVQAIEYCIDITNRKKVENGLIRSEAMLRRLIESAPIGIMIVKQGTYSYVNEAMVKMFGYDSRNEIDGRRLESLYAAEYRDLFRNGYLATESEDAECHVQEVRAIRRNGESFCASIWLRSIEFEGDPALLGFLVDVSEEQTLRSQLLLAQKMEALGTLAGGIAHDFNNILFAIMGYTELSMELVPKGTKLHEDLKAVLDAANRAKELVGQILTISRQRSESKKVPLKIGPIVKEIMKFLKASLPATIAMRHDITGEPAAIVGSATQIHQMLMNLCTNAAHAMQETGGELSVKVDHILVDAKDLSRYPDMSPGRYLRITVTDNGHGMAPDILQQIFEPYFTTKGPVEGTGLGLAVVREIVKTHGGVISVESEPARGTTFEVIFPLIEEQSVREEMDTPRVLVEPGTERILVVDDDKALTSMTGQILARLGYQVTTRTSSTDALELFRSMPSHFDLVMTDLIMPKMTGSDLTKAIMRIRPDIPVIICTGHMDLMTPEQADALGIAAILMKPLLKKELAQTIRRVLDRHRGASQNSASKGDNNCPGPLEAPQ